MIFSGVRYYGEDFRFHYGDIEVEGGRFAAVTERGGDVTEGCDSMIPGMVDIHIHGNSGFDFSDGNYEGLNTIVGYLARAGTTSFSAASMTLPEDTLSKAYKNAVKFRDEASLGCAAIRGITMEGPFFSEAKKGAQAAEHLRLPDIDMLRRLQAAADGMIRIVCVAPELNGAEAFIREAKAMGVIVSAAHTNACYNEAAAGFDAGISHLTHLYNAMPPLLHREPGVIGATAERPDVTAELISDGVHVHPSAVRAALKLFGPERICLISDAIPAAGLTEGGTAMLAGQQVTITNGRAVLADGTLAGSIASLFDCFRRAVDMGVPAEDALRCAAYNPAKVIGAGDTGVIAVGKRADFLLCGAGWSLKDVYIGGNKVERAQKE
jgi:N-acetylglucosamine-6-phosphate deacetylase